MGTAYDGQFATVDQATGKVVYPTATGVWNGFIDFLTANFQRECQPGHPVPSAIKLTLSSQSGLPSLRDSFLVSVWVREPKHIIVAI